MTLLLALSQTATAAVWVVPQDYPTLQGAVSASQSGDTILVDPYGVNANTGEPWAPESQSTTTISHALTIEPFDGSTRVALPPLKVVNGANLTLNTVELLGGYSTSLRVDDGGLTTLESVMLYADNGSVVTGNDVLMDGASSGADGGVVALDAVANFTGVTAINFSEKRPFYILSEGGYASLTATGVTISDNEGGGIYANGGMVATTPGLVSVTIYDGEMSNNHAQHGGAIRAIDVEYLVLYALEMAGNSASGEGGAVHGEDVAYANLSLMTLSGMNPARGDAVEVSGAAAGVLMRAVDITESTWGISDVSFDHMIAEGSGGALAADAVQLSLAKLTAHTLEAEAGAFLFADGGSLAAEQLDIRDFEVGELGGAFSLRGVSRVADLRPTLRSSKICHGSGVNAGVSLAMDAVSSDVLVDFTLFQFNARETVPLVKADGGQLGLVNITFADNDASALVHGVGAQLLLTNSILSGGQVGLEVSDAISVVHADYNLWWDLLGDLATGPQDLGIPAAQDIVQSADFWSGYIGSDCDTNPLLRWNSPARDAAVSPASWLGVDAAQVWGLTDAMYSADPDLSPADMGAFAGIFADYPFNTDDDGDGWILGYDCDDDPSNGQSAEVNPGAEETWYDGVDSDCDGQDDYDADQDGHRSQDHGGDDCDDTRADVSPSAVEIAGDDVDNDCDGDIDEGGEDSGVFGATRYALSGGCSSAGGPPGAFLLAGLLLLARRRLS